MKCPNNLCNIKYTLYDLQLIYVEKKEELNVILHTFTIKKLKEDRYKGTCSNCGTINEIDEIRCTKCRSRLIFK